MTDRELLGVNHPEMVRDNATEMFLRTGITPSVVLPKQPPHQPSRLPNRVQENERSYTLQYTRPLGNQLFQEFVRKMVRHNRTDNHINAAGSSWNLGRIGKHSDSIRILV